jgi:hypothetical protein
MHDTTGYKDRATIGEWTIKEDMHKRELYPGETVWIVASHDTCEVHSNGDFTTKGKMLSWTLSDGSKRCYWCQAEVPDEVQALMVLYSEGVSS